MLLTCKIYSLVIKAVQFRLLILVVLSRANTSSFLLYTTMGKVIFHKMVPGNGYIRVEGQNGELPIFTILYQYYFFAVIN